MKKIVTLLKLILIFAIASVFSAIIIGLFIGFTGIVSGNSLTSNTGKVVFNPIISIAYLLVYYFLVLFYQPSSKSQYQMFILTLLLSFSMQFIQGSFFLIICFYLLRKGKLI